MLSGLTRLLVSTLSQGNVPTLRWHTLHMHSTSCYSVVLGSSDKLAKQLFDHTVTTADPVPACLPAWKELRAARASSGEDTPAPSLPCATPVPPFPCAFCSIRQLAYTYTHQCSVKGLCRENTPLDVKHCQFLSYFLLVLQTMFIKMFKS